MLSGEALQIVLDSRGYKTSFGLIEDSFDNSRIHKVKPEVIIWDESILVKRRETIFDLLKHLEFKYRSVFILNNNSIHLLGMGLTKGIEGYIHTKCNLEELYLCLDQILRGGVFISSKLNGTYQVNKVTNGGARNMQVELTEQEEKILRLISQKKTSKEIAKILNISYKTVQNHRHNMCQKLGLKGRNKLYEFSLAYFD